MYIEKVAHKIGHKYKVTVATSDGLEQLIIMRQGAIRMSAQDLKKDMESMQRYLEETYHTTDSTGKQTLSNGLAKQLKKLNLLE